MEQTLLGMIGVMALFVIFVLPVWLILHYLNRWKMIKAGVQPDREQQWQVLQIKAEKLELTTAKLEERIRVLESILDEKAPEWRRYR